MDVVALWRKSFHSIVDPAPAPVVSAVRVTNVPGLTPSQHKHTGEAGVIVGVAGEGFDTTV